LRDSPESCHGSTLVTRDLDVCAILSPDAIERLREICRVISVEDSIAAKQAMGRDKDLIAVKELQAIIESTGNR
jgi:hypothetical protein